MCGEKPRRSKCFKVGVVSARIRDFYEWDKILRVGGDERVLAETVARAVCYCEGKGFQPGCAAFGLRGEDDVVLARLEGILEQHDLANQVRSAPIVLV